MGNGLVLPDINQIRRGPKKVWYDRWSAIPHLMRLICSDWGIGRYRWNFLSGASPALTQRTTRRLRKQRLSKLLLASVLLLLMYCLQAECTICPAGAYCHAYHIQNALEPPFFGNILPEGTA